ncbi:TetR/AcrR family transcriptional regulator [Streptomyces sp. NPDC090052]|uniref:TetR/AcrR family transcriptional regulator n=1 Tax=Streptomyces sp. NPDC090052 TaxID=3365931 RepID=UPI00382A28C0
MRTGEIKRVVARRPPDRRELILAAAGDLFRERGFHNVSVADVAAAVDITAPALYRHFRNKRELLSEVVGKGLGLLEATVREAADPDELLATLATVGAERRGLATLWQREARHLTDARREELRQQLNGIAAQLASLVREARTDLSPEDGELLAWALLAITSSASRQRITLSRRRLEELMHEITRSVAYCRLGSPTDTTRPARRAQAPAGSATQVASRREQLLTEAIRLFDERGFQSVSTDDIGEAVGSTGPSIYKHFPSKTDLLVAAVVRGGERRQVGTDQALDGASSPMEALESLLRSYIDFALENSRLIGLLLTELDQLPEKYRRSSRQVQRDYLALWGRLLGDARPGLDTAEGKLLVGAVLTVIDDAVRTARLTLRPDLADRLAEIGTTVLLLGSEEG